MAKAKIKTHKMANVQRKNSQDRRIANWNRHQSSGELSFVIKELKEPHPFTDEGGEYEAKPVVIRNNKPLAQNR